MSTLVAGFVGPPGWKDPSPTEFAAISGVAAIGVSLELGVFDWRLDRIASTEPLITEAATALVERGATAVGIVGTPFGWAGLDNGERPHRRNERISVACGVPVVSAVSGTLDWLDDLRARRLALAATYYDPDWCERWERFLSGLGYTVTRCASMADLGIVDAPLDAADETHWAPTDQQIEATVVGAKRPVRADAVVVSGAGARTLTCHEQLVAAAGTPVVTADLGLYRSMIRTVEIDPATLPGKVDHRSWWPAAEVGA